LLVLAGGEYEAAILQHVQIHASKSREFTSNLPLRVIPRPF
jgi:hypothetical protein